MLSGVEEALLVWQSQNWLIEILNIVVQGKDCVICFNVGQQRTKIIFDYIRTDIWGSLTPTHSNGRYFLSVIDDCWSKLIIYP